MTVPISTRRWRSIASPSAFALELTARPLDPSALRQFLASLPEKELRDAAFVVVRLGALERERSKPIVVAANTWSHSARLCLAVDRGTLERIDFGALVAERVGLILDDVDAETPLSAIARDSVEAIRFGADFVARARGNVRVGCVLATMLDLASNLGLGTLGPAAAANDVASHSPVSNFDFVPSSGFDAGADQPEGWDRCVPSHAMISVTRPNARKRPPLPRPSRTGA
jgi:hypothetical protein